MGTACYVKGAEKLLATVRDSAGGANQEAGGNGPFIRRVPPAAGACGLAPVVVFDGEVCGNVESPTAADRMKGWQVDGPR